MDLYCLLNGGRFICNITCKFYDRLCCINCLKNIFTEFKTREVGKSDDLLVVPFSIQETEYFREDVEVLSEKIVLSSSSDSSDLQPKEATSSSEDDWAEVQVEEVELDVKDVKDDKCKDAKPKNTLRRFAFFH